MEISIEGKKYLNSNTYDNLIISNKQANLDCVLITASTKNTIDVSNLISKKGITEVIKEYEPQNQILNIIDYHLNNNRICSIKGLGKLEVFSINNKRLVYKTSVLEKDFNEMVSRKIFLQYQMDRYTYLNNHADIQIYEFCVDNELSYEMIDNKICVKLYRGREWQVIEKEQIFLLEFIHQKLHEKDCYAKLMYFEKCLRSEGDKAPLPYFKILCGDLQIIIYGAEREFKTAICNLINFYNFNREYQLRRKLNMEGYNE